MKLLLILLSVLILFSCELENSENSEFSDLNLKENLILIFGKKIRLISDFDGQNLDVSIDSIPENITSVEYNQLLGAYIAFQAFEKKSDCKSIRVEILHSYNDIKYEYIYTNDRLKIICSDFKNDQYSNLVEYLLANTTDYDLAYYQLTMSQANRLYPNHKSEESYISLLCKSIFKNDRNIYSLAESNNLDFELKLFYWVSQFDYDDLHYNRQKLKQSLLFLNEKDFDSWDKQYLDSIYLLYY